MAKKGAGLMMFRRRPGGHVDVLLVHPGGPFWARKDVGAWSVPKGEYMDAEDALDAAKREFAEETGLPVSGPFVALGSIKQPGGKTVSVWAFEGDCDPALLVSNEFEMEWPPGSGRKQAFKEVDRAEWFDTDEARVKLLKGQIGFVDALLEALEGGSPTGER